MSATEQLKQVVQEVKQPKPLVELIRSATKEIGKVLPSHMSPERLVGIAVTAIKANPKLMECTPASFMGSLFAAAQIGIEPVHGLAYLIPFNNKRKIGNEWKTFKECQFILGYKGIANLFYRHEKSVQLSWGVVKEKDEFDYRYGTDMYLKHKPAIGDRGKVIGYYVVTQLSAGARGLMFMQESECLEHGLKHSKTVISKIYNKEKGQYESVEAPYFQDDSPWVSDREAMCLKTVLIQISKLLPLSFETQRAIALDETSRDYREGIVDVLSEPSTTAWQEENEPAKIEPSKVEKSIPGGLV